MPLQAKTPTKAPEFDSSITSGVAMAVFCTNGHEISKDNDTAGMMKWYDQSDFSKASCNDTEGWQKMNVRYRGASSMTFAKKQYGINFVNNKGKDVELSVGGLPKTNKLAFRTPYIDRSYMRDTLAYELGRKMGQSRGDQYAAPHTRFVQIFLNGEYEGIFILSEKIDYDFLPIDKLNEKNLSNLTYLMEISARDYSFKTHENTMVKYTYPSENKLKKLETDNFLAHELVTNFIEGEINHFEEVLNSRHFKDPVKGYRSLIDVPSFIDYFLMQEITKNIDGFRRSEYFYKGTDGKFHMGPLWDFDIAWGNLSMYHMNSSKGWSHKKFWMAFPSVFWFDRLLKDEYFREELRKRYMKLRLPGGLLGWDKLDESINDLVNMLGNAPELDKQRWEGTQNLVQTLIMNTKERSDTFEGNVKILKDWLKFRLAWLDDKIAKDEF
jgi:hypothetical protein